MLDIKFIREHPEKVKENLKKRFHEEKIKLLDSLLKKDELWRKLKKQSDDSRSRRNKISIEINLTKKEGKNTLSLLKEAKSLPAKIKDLEEKTLTLENEIHDLLMQIPNMIHSSVPIGKDSTKNVVKDQIGKIKEFDFEIKNHAELGESLGVLDFDSSAELSGNGFYILRGKLALLNQALIEYARDFMLSKGYEYVEPPLLIKKRVLEGVYSNSEIEQMSYKVEEEDLYLIATSEHPVVGMFINKTLN